MQHPATIVLYPALCGERQRPTAETGALRASLFRYSSGVEALRLCNARGELIVLPWLGGMIWSARFDGVDLVRGRAGAGAALRSMPVRRRLPALDHAGGGDHA